MFNPLCTRLLGRTKKINCSTTVVQAQAFAFAFTFVTVAFVGYVHRSYTRLTFVIYICKSFVMFRVFVLRFTQVNYNRNSLSL